MRDQPGWIRPVSRASLAVSVLTLLLLGLGQAGPARAITTPCGLAGHHCATETLYPQGTGAGTVESYTDASRTTPDHFLDCRRAFGVLSGTCAHTYDVGSQAIFLWLVDMPDPGSFACPATGGPCALTAVPDTAKLFTSDTNTGFSFPLQYPTPLTISRVGSGSGQVTSSPTGISCGSICTTVFARGQPVSLTARPDPGSVFKAWSGAACQNQGSTCALAMDATTSLDARFERAATATPSPTHQATATHTPLASPATSPPGSVVPASAGPSATGSSSATPSALAIAASPPVATTSSTDLTPVAIAIVIAAIVLGGGLAFVGVELRRRGGPRS